MRKTSFLYLLIIAQIFLSCGSKTSSPKPSEVLKALETFELEKGFKIELIASEPLIGDPVDMEIDEFGRLYVVEMPGYPLDKSGSGKVKLLRDTDADGLMDESTIFAENLILPNSIMRWKKGLLVTDAPNVLYLEDTNDDGRADLRDTLLTGFALSNPQHNLNSPLLSLDNWIYLAHEGAVSTETYQKEFGDPGSEIYFPDRPKGHRLNQNANGRAVRFKPDDGQLEILSSHTQFGHTFDRWGNHLLVGNANHIYHEVIAQSYLQRNPALLISDATQSISDHGDAAEVFPITQNPEHQLLTDVGVITSACGLTAYNGGAFPDPYNENITFVAEPVSNLIHADEIKNKGATFIASRVKPHQEFLSSTDAKFRPVNMYVGPDGALYVVDYYRQIIEHPEWMGQEVIESGDLYNDIDKGRIYRISEKNAKPATWTKGLTLGNATDEELVYKLADPNIWWRQNAQRLLVDRKSKTSINLLGEMATSDAAMGRLHALWTLEGLKQLKSFQIQKALQDSEAGIRENAIKLAELHLADSPSLVNSLLSLQSDPDAKVRFQLLCTLGSVDSKSAEKTRLHLLLKDIRDKWAQDAALSASPDLMPLLNVVIEKYGSDIPADVGLLEKLVAVIASGEKKETVRQLIANASQAGKQNRDEVHSAILQGIANGLQNKKSGALFTEADQRIMIQTFFETQSSTVRKATLHAVKVISDKNTTLFTNAIRRAALLATDAKQPESKRADVIDFIALQNPAPYVDVLKELFVPQEPLTVQLAALRALSAIPDTTVSHYLLENWSLLTPQLQDAAVSTFLLSDDRINILLNSIERQRILPASISWPRRVRLMAQSNEKLRNRSRKIFAENNGEEINNTYETALQLKGDVENGKVIYQKNCGVCHQIRGTMGVSIGPDLGTIHNWSARAIMKNTLAPNLSISSGFDLWTIELTQGETIQGLIASETPGALTIRNVGSMDRTIKRQDIKSLKALNMSVMPSGLEKQISQQQMADLLAFLKQNK